MKATPLSIVALTFMASTLCAADGAAPIFRAGTHAFHIDVPTNWSLSVVSSGARACNFSSPGCTTDREVLLIMMPRCHGFSRYCNPIGRFKRSADDGRRCAIEEH